MWWRPGYLKMLDEMARLDRKSLPFSYLVLVRSDRPISEILPGTKSDSIYRLVSPAHEEGRDLEFFVCGPEGKRRVRYRAPEKTDEKLDRGDILKGVQHLLRDSGR
jgi:hypothetical protein